MSLRLSPCHAPAPWVPTGLGPQPLEATPLPGAWCLRSSAWHQRLHAIRSLLKNVPPCPCFTPGSVASVLDRRKLRLEEEVAGLRSHTGTRAQPELNSGAVNGSPKFTLPYGPHKEGGRCPSHPPWGWGRGTVRAWPTWRNNWLGTACSPQPSSLRSPAGKGLGIRNRWVAVRTKGQTGVSCLPLGTSSFPTHDFCLLDEHHPGVPLPTVSHPPLHYSG